MVISTVGSGAPASASTAERGLGVVPYSPSAGGVFTGTYSRDGLTVPNAASGDGTRRASTSPWAG